MPEIKHDTASQAKAVVAAISDPAINTSNDKLEAALEAILSKKKAAVVEAAKPVEPNWTNMTETDAMEQDIYIPVIEHEIPDYMNMKLLDTAYEVVWASRDQRRIGQLLAQGYELLKKEHVHPSFALPLLFDSEGNYVYVDVIAMRVHKRILYGKRRKALQLSCDQLANRNRPPRVKMTGSYQLSNAVPDSPFVGANLYSDIM